MTASELRKPFAALEPYAHGYLQTGEGHEIYHEECGNPEGIPALFLHGGPGSGSSAHHRRLFDPRRYRIVLFDQRGCGRSRPLGSLENNTTWHLVADIERLRQRLGIERWLLFGGSWGATLALVYAQTHPDRVAALILRGIFSGRRSELDWFYEAGANRLFPDLWENLLAVLPVAEQDNVIAAYRTLLSSEDRGVRAAAARAWSAWEAATVTLRNAPPPSAPGMVGDGTIAFARIENHYFYHDVWLEEGQILRDIDLIAHLPAVIIQGRYDVVTPVVTSYEIAQAWPKADYRLVEGAGHAFAEPGILHELLGATERFASEIAP